MSQQVNAANSENVINHWSMVWGQLKHLTCVLLALWPHLGLLHEVAVQIIPLPPINEVAKR